MLRKVIGPILFICFVSISAQDFPFRDPRLPLVQRLDDLLSRLNISELIDQVSRGGAGPSHGPAPGIDHLGIGPYQWRTNPGDGEVTSFPLPINQASTFDARSVYRIARAMCLEMRARRNMFNQIGTYKDGEGIHLFAPVASIMHHPLWGRNQETYGEDPFLSALMARAFVRGCGGWDSIDPMQEPSKRLTSHVLLVGTDCKHFAVHSGPDSYPESRLSFEAQVPKRDIWLTYMPAFHACLDAGAVSVMCAYSGINGTPDCTNRWLLTEVLREQMKFPGFVVSDNGALQFAISKHKAYMNDSAAALAAVSAGVNLQNSVDYLKPVFSALPDLVREGNISRHQLVEMARPLFLTRFLQAEFDPPESDPYRNLAPSKLVHSLQHERLSMIETARSIVLLHQRDNLLPLDKVITVGKRPLKHLLVLGPFATSVDELYGGYLTVREAQFESSVSKGLSTLAEKTHAHEICTNGGLCPSYEATTLEALIAMEDLDCVVLTVGTGNKWEGESHDRHNISLPGLQKQMMMHSLDLSAGRGTTRRLNAVPVILLVFSTGPVDIAVALSDNNVKAIMWCGFPGPHIGDALKHIFRGYESDTFGSQRPLSWAQAGEASEHWSQTSFEGYWWIPAARLPFTWYKSIDNLAKITSYEMSNQTYRYLFKRSRSNETKHEIPILFPFGFGLSYNTLHSGQSGFVYSEMIKPSQVVGINQPFVVYATVSNVGMRASEEVVQLYIEWINQSLVTDDVRNPFSYPDIQLAGIERVALAVGENKQVKFVLNPQEHLVVWSTVQEKLIPGRGTLRLVIGGQQPDQETKVASNLLSGYVTIN